MQGCVSPVRRFVYKKPSEIVDIILCLYGRLIFWFDRVLQ